MTEESVGSLGLKIVLSGICKAWYLSVVTEIHCTYRKQDIVSKDVRNMS